MLYGGIEAGGTKFVCVVGSGPEVVARCRIATADPASTLARVIAFFREAEGTHGRCAAFGLGAFGPLDLDPTSARYGHLLATPKDGWSGADLLGPLRAALARPLALATDVQAAAVGEARWGAGQGARTLVYVTVGTGIGGAVLRDGAPLDPVHHPELGHIRVPRAPGDAAFPGVCRFHGDCLEGLASGPAIVARWAAPLAALPSEHPAWEIEARLLAHLAATLRLVVAPERIVCGGGVGAAPGLLERVRRHLTALLDGYPTPLGADDLAAFLVPPALGELAGALGALALAEAAT